MPLESYVVRIYRRSGPGRHDLVGLVEAEGIGAKLAFTNAEELWEILARRPPEKARKAKPGSQRGTARMVTPIGAYVSRRSDEGERE